MVLVAPCISVTHELNHAIDAKSIQLFKCFNFQLTLHSECKVFVGVMVSIFGHVKNGKIPLALTMF